jgi:hypothetical protein
MVVVCIFTFKVELKACSEQYHKLALQPDNVFCIQSGSCQGNELCENGSCKGNPEPWEECIGWWQQCELQEVCGMQSLCYGVSFCY